MTSIRKFLSHKQSNSTMIYARVHDHTVAEDYYAAMNRIEQQLLVPARGDVGSLPDKDPAGASMTGNEREQPLDLAAQLAEPDLSIEIRLGLVDRMRRMLNHNTPSEEK